jgi:hypothetical protein
MCKLHAKMGLRVCVFNSIDQPARKIRFEFPAGAGWSW